MAGEKKLKVGVSIGGGTPPGYQWNVLYLAVARKEVMDVLTESEYHHLVDQFKEMAYEQNPIDSPAAWVEPIEDFYELKDKFKGRNIRVFFAVYGKGRNIVILGVHDKDNEDQTPVRVLVRIRRRKRWYETAEFAQS